MTTGKLKMTELVAAQAVPETTVNENDRILEAFASSCTVEDRDLAAPPGTCADSACYLVAASPTGLWAGKAGQIAIAVGTNAVNGWKFVPAFEGMTLWVRDENAFLGYNGSSYIQLGGAPTESFVVACSDETTAITAGTGKVAFRMPYAFNVTAVYASLTTAQSSGSIFTVDINEGGTSILSTKLTIDNTEKTSRTAAAPPVISDASIAADAEVTIDVDQVGDGTAKGLKVTIVGNQ